MTSSGQLLGIAVAKIKGSSLGFAIPRRILDETINGRIYNVQVRQRIRGNDEGLYNIRVDASDPLGRILTVSAKVFQLADQKVKQPNADGSWPAAADEWLKEFSLTRFSNGQQASSFQQLDASIPFPSREIGIQFVARFRDGSEVYNEPISFDQARQIRLATSRSDATSAVVTTLPVYLSDTVLDSESGELLGLSATSDEIVRISPSQLETNNLDQLEKISLPGRGRLIAIKEHNGQRFLALQCYGEETCHVINLDDGTLMKSFDVPGISRSKAIVKSDNPSDPYLYISGDLVTAIDLRTMAVYEILKAKHEDLGISHDGRFLYAVRSRSTYCCEMVRSKEGDPPDVLLYTNQVNSSSDAIISEPSGTVLIAGTRYTADLGHALGPSPRRPQCSFGDLPLVISLPGRQSQTSRGNFDRDQLVLSVDQIDSLGGPDTGAAIALPDRLKLVYSTFSKKWAQSLKVSGSTSVVARLRVLADDHRKQILAIKGNQLLQLPLVNLGFPDGPWMVPKNRQLKFTVGRENKYQAEFASSNPTAIDSSKMEAVACTFENLPGSATINPGGFAWKPTIDEIGMHQISMQTKVDGDSFQSDMRIEVSLPKLEAPFPITSLALAPSGKFFLATSVQNASRRYNGRAFETEQGKTRVAVIPLDANRDALTGVIPYPIRDYALVGTKMAVIGENQTATKSDVYDLRSMSRVKTILAGSPVRDLATEGNTLVLIGDRTRDVYDTKSFRRIRSEKTEPVSRSHVTRTETFVDGKVENGLFYMNGTKGSPSLVLAPAVLSMRRLDRGFNMLNFLRQPIRESVQLRGINQAAVKIVGICELNDGAFQAVLERYPQMKDNRGFTYLKLRIYDKDGLAVYEEVVVKQPIYRSYNADPILVSRGDRLYIGMQNRIYLWNASTFLSAQPSGQEKEKSLPLHFVPKQSELVLRGRSSKLMHQLKGGTEPYEYYLVSEHPAYQFDDSDASLKIDNEQLREEATDFVANKFSNTLRQLRSRNRNESVNIQQYVAGEMRKQSAYLGMRLKQMIVAMPVHIKAVDQGGSVTEIGYYVLVPIDQKSLTRAVSDLVPPPAG
ncbi:MAG: hypothetical protein AAF958_09530 [Planctomycetota bacterium]